MRILLITNAYPSKDKPFAGIFVKNQYEELKRDKNIKADIFYLERTFTTTTSSALKYLFAYVRYLPILMKKYDIVHIHFLSLLYVLPYIHKIIFPSTKIIITFHGSDVNGSKNSMLKLFYKFLLKKNDVSIGVGESLRQSVKNNFKIDLDYVLCAGINDRIFNYLAIDFEERNIDLLYVGSFYTIKGVDLLAEAIKLLGNKNIKIVFAGSGPLITKINKLKEEQLNVVIKSNISQFELNELYNKAKFLVVPSRSEGFGLSLAEGMSCGTPAIISNIKQLKFQVEHMKNGLVIANNNSKSLAEMFKIALKINRAKWYELSNHALKVAKQYTLSYVCECLKEIYRTSTLVKES